MISSDRLRDARAASEDWQRLAAAERRLLLLDFDGTLAPFEVDRARARAVPGALEAMRAIVERGIATIGLVSGRPLDELEALTGRLPLPMVGEHGWEEQTPDGDRMRIAKHGEDGADHAVSFYRIVEQAGQNFAWLEMEPYTGRTHQLRVHAAHIGHPILGDPKYFDADVNWNFPGGVQNRLHLHARHIDIPHPSGGRFLFRPSCRLRTSVFARSLSDEAIQTLPRAALDCFAFGSQ